VAIDQSTDAAAELERLKRKRKRRLQPAGGIWLLRSKRARPGYVNQGELIQAGKSAGLVDNKVCSVSDGSDGISGMRFVIRVRGEDRVHRAG
jgi:hypothetical protein